MDDSSMAGREMDEVWRLLEGAGGALPAAQLAGLRAGVALGAELCAFSEENGIVQLLF